MSLAKVNDEWIPLQITVFTRWVNTHLKGVIDQDLQDITQDLASGVHLVELAQVLTQKPVERWNKDPKGRTVFMVQNCDIAIDAFTKDGIQLVGISGKDINDKKEKLILGLIWTLILKYSIGKSIDASNSGSNDNDGKSSRNALLDWAIERTQNYPNVNNFQPYDLSMCALLDSYVPDKINYNSLNQEDIENNARKSAEVMNELGIPVYIYPEDVVKNQNKVDDKTLLTQLAAAKVVLDNLPPPAQERAINLEDEEAERLARENAGNDDLMSLIDQLRKELNDVKNQLDNSNDRISNLERENDSLRKGFSCLKYEVKKLKDAHRTPEGGVAVLNEQPSANQPSENQGQPSWVISGERSVPQGGNDNSEEVNQLRGDVAQAKNLATSLQSENEQLRSDLQRVQSELQNLNSQLQSIPNTSSSVPEDLLQKVNEASEANQKLNQLQNENSSLSQALDNLKNEVQKLREERQNNSTAEPVQAQGEPTWVVSGENTPENAANSANAANADKHGVRHEINCLKYEVKKLKAAQNNK